MAIVCIIKSYQPDSINEIVKMKYTFETAKNAVNYIFPSKLKDLHPDHEFSFLESLKIIAEDQFIKQNAYPQRFVGQSEALAVLIAASVLNELYTTEKIVWGDEVAFFGE